MDARRSINTRVWSDSWFEELDSFPKLLWLHLLTNQQTNLLGIYEISPRRISNETGITPNDCQTILKGFEKDKKAFYKDGYILIPNWIKNQQMNANMMISAKKIYESLPEKCKIWIKSLGFDDFESLANGSPTLTEPWGEIEIEIEREIEKEKESENFHASVPEAPSVEEQLISEPSTEISFFSPDIIPPVPKPEEEKEEKKKVTPKKKTQLDMMEEVTMPHPDPEFKMAWLEWLKYKTLIRDTYKAPETMQAAVNKFADYPPDVGILAIKDSISNQWKGVFPENKKYQNHAADHRTIRKTAREPQPGKGFGTLQSGGNKG